MEEKSCQTLKIDREFRNLTAGHGEYCIHAMAAGNADQSDAQSAELSAL